MFVYEKKMFCNNIIAKITSTKGNQLCSFNIQYIISIHYASLNTDRMIDDLWDFVLPYLFNAYNVMTIHDYFLPKNSICL